MASKDHGPDIQPTFTKECLCGGYNLHFKTVVVSHSRADDGMVNTYVFGSIGRNAGCPPSVHPGEAQDREYRGGGVEMHFDCEQCRGTYIERQTFHEGSVYVDRALLKKPLT